MDIADTAAERAHAILEDEGRAAPELLSADIYQSWQRCIERGQDPRRTPKPQAQSLDKLEEAREKCGQVRRLALLELQELHRQIAGSSFMIGFADSDCMMLDVLADPDFEEIVGSDSLQPGCVWTEAACGTNALGAAVLERRLIVVHGPEHFYRGHLGLTCVAHPVIGPDGSLAGVIDATSRSDGRPRHTQALLRLAATQIENGLFREHFRDQTLVAFHHGSDYLHSLSTGLLAVREDGVVVGGNTQANNFLHRRLEAHAVDFQDIFGVKFDVLRDDQRRSPMRVKDFAGAAYFAKVDSAGFTRPVTVRRPSKGRTGPPTAIPTAFVADDAHVATIVRQVESAAARQLPILIRGETGTGKELLARHAHLASNRKGPFVPINCAALPESLIEAELFGYAEGSFTGARKGGSTGLVGEANGGTLFLDEIGDLPMTLQAVLLRLLDDWTVRPIGGQRTKVDVQLVSATNVKLTSAIASGRFRSDLLYRMNTLEVTLPPLSQRSDIEAIAQHLLARMAPDCELDAGALDHLVDHPWPGNIRQLRNELARASLGAVDGIITRATIEAACGHRHGASEIGSDEPAAVQAPGDLSLKDVQRERILAVLAEVGGNVSQAARRLGISRNTVYRTMGQSGSDDN